MSFHPTFHPTTRGARTAVIGSGVSGLTAAYVLSRMREVTLFEADRRLGGHAHTHDVDGAAGPVRVDSGFIVHNDQTYPHLNRLFAELGIAVRDTEMSMSIVDPNRGIEFAGGRGLRGFIAHPSQLLRRDYATMLAAVRRFHRLASQYLNSSDGSDQLTYGDFIAAHGFSQSFIDLYAVPLVSCVWSSGRADALGYPARYLFTFLDHHGMLSVSGSPQWRTVVGGSVTYVDAVAARIGDVRRGVRVTSVLRGEHLVQVRTDAGVEEFDSVVIATHGDDALGLLADPSPAEKEILGAFRYTANRTVLHRDSALMPRAAPVRASWNYRVRDAGVDQGGPMVTYWMNRLMNLSAADQLFVSLGAEDDIDPAAVIATMEYRHPVYDLDSVQAARRRDEITTSLTAYAGAHWGWGFHEDGCRSGVEAAAALGVRW